MQRISIATNGERFYDITDLIKKVVKAINLESGIVLLFCPHTSSALTITEAWDPKAKEDLQNFLRHLAPRNLEFIKHKSEGPDDSPSHMKSLILQQSISLIVEQNELLLGQWQGIYLAEFRDNPHMREIWIKTAP